MFLERNVVSQIIAILPASLSYFAGGIGCGWVPPTLHKFLDADDEFSLSPEDCSQIAALHYAGKAVACLLTVHLIDKVGRSPMFVFCGLSLIGVWLAVLATTSVPLHLAIRFLFGLAVGAIEVATPVYVGENSSPQLRGIFGSICILLFYAGELVAFSVATCFSYTSTALVFLALSVAYSLSTCLLREPGQHLLARGREAEAADNFFAVHGTGELAKREFEETKRSLLQPAAGHRFSLGLLGDRSIRVVCVVNLFMYLTGYPPINAMSSLAFEPIGHLTPNELTILLGILQLLAVACSSAIIERFGRRPLLLGSALVCALFHAVSASIYIFDARGTPLPFAPVLLFVFITGYSVVTAALIFPICTVIKGELMSPQLKPVGGCLSVVLNSVVSVAMTSTFLLVAKSFGMACNFLFFAVMSVAMFVYVYVDQPETKGLTLPEIQRALQKSANPRGFGTRSIQQDHANLYISTQSDVIPIQSM